MSELAQFIRLSETERGPVLTNIQLPDDFPWPPPETIYTVCPHGMGWEQAVMAPDTSMADEIAEFMEEFVNKGMDLGYTMTPWRQISCSKLDDDMVRAGGHVARGAEYVPEKEES